MFSAVSIGPELRPKLINISSLVLKEVAHILNCEFAHEAPSNSSICDPSRTHVLCCQHWTGGADQANKHTFLSAQGWNLEAEVWASKNPTLFFFYHPTLWDYIGYVVVEVVHILNCAFAHEAPSNSSICDPWRTHVLGCQHWTRAATQSDKHTFLGAQLDHTTRGCGANLLSVSKIPMDKLTDSPAVVEAIEIRTSDWRSLLSISDFKARLGVKKFNELLDF
ncbi:hypothetical protein MTR67_005989 [Solanum verrucosum]|uniref:Uncharacterized protein n=1 Tax=Solanum verrucosum TaxID=315347 RepID=A0AAF0Q364_SOLVR|nr:hypothetical protein MTR67_005989 [Solanum verrucosum]